MDRNESYSTQTKTHQFQELMENTLSPLQDQYFIREAGLGERNTMLNDPLSVRSRDESDRATTIMTYSIQSSLSGRS